MGYATLAACVADMERAGQLVRITAEVDPHLELGAIQRRAFQAKAPALLFTRVRGCVFPMLANLYGTRERIRYIFRDALPALEQLFRVKADPMEALRHWRRSLGLPRAAWHTLPRTVRQGSVTECRARLADLPQLVSWPRDGGAFVTLPLVYTEHPQKPGYAASNLGMYRVQLGGNAYGPDEAGLHYQIHRGIGPHHAAALARGERLPVNVCVGGPPALTLAAVMPLPEGLSELHFAGALGGMRMPMLRMGDGLPMPAHADFCICGHIAPHCKPEGPFGDHLGYYSLTHDFPVLKVDAVYHRREAIWPFTTVGRPPQEDTLFGEFIHDLTGPLVPQVFSGVHEVHAVDAAGVHPLLLAVGSERYVPYAQERRPQELITCALSVLGSTQTALAKYVFMAAREDDGSLSAHDVPRYFRHMLERTDFARDLHFLTRVTTDTLDYTGTDLNTGSKCIWVAAGAPRRRLGTELPSCLPLPAGFDDVRLFAPGMVVLRGPAHTTMLREAPDPRLEELARALETLPDGDAFPMVVVVDDAAFTAASWNNFLWVTFTRSDPARDMYGAFAAIHGKHWGCRPPLALDARLKAFQAPPLEEDPSVTRRVEALGAPGGPLHGYI